MGKNSHKWRAQIRNDGKDQYLGYFEDEEEAAKAYDSATLPGAHLGRRAVLGTGVGARRLTSRGHLKATEEEAARACGYRGTTDFV
jgi:hypothetical protein